MLACNSSCWSMGLSQARQTSAPSRFWGKQKRLSGLQVWVRPNQSSELASSSVRSLFVGEDAVLWRLSHSFSRLVQSGHPGLLWDVLTWSKTKTIVLSALRGLFKLSAAWGSDLMLTYFLAGWTGSCGTGIVLLVPSVTVHSASLWGLHSGCYGICGCARVWSSLGC